MDLLTPRQVFLLLLWSLVLLTVTLIYLSGAKTYRKIKRKQLEESKESSRLAVYKYLEGNTAHFPLPGKQALCELLLEFSHVLQDEDVHKRVNTLASLHLSDWLKKKLKSGSWSSRMNALYVIEDLRLFHLLAEVKKIQKKKNLTQDEAAQILKILAVSNDRDFLPQLTNSRMNYSDFTVLSILKNCSANQIFACCKVYSDLPASIKYNLITLLGDLQLFEQRNLIELLLQSGDSEEKLRALKAVSDMSLPVQPEMLSSYLHSPNWLERMMVLKVIGSLRSDIYLDDAKRLLGDKEYSVRLEAARTLLSFKNGKQLLEEVIHFSDDLFARDMALEWISKGGSRSERV